MNTKFVLSFALLYAACIALICAVYVWLMSKRKAKKAPEQNNQEQ